jgi:hypothetical protein
LVSSESNTTWKYIIFESPAFEILVQFHCNEKKLKEVKGKLRDFYYKLAKQIGLLKLANKIHELGLVFKPSSPSGRVLNFADFIDKKEMKFLGKEK